MIKTILGKFEKGKIIPLERLANPASCRIYNRREAMTEKKMLSMVKKADAMYQKGELREVKSLKDLD